MSANQKVYYDFVKARVGSIQLMANENGILNISFPSGRKRLLKSRLIPAVCKTHLAKCKEFLRAYGDRHNNLGRRCRRVSVDWDGKTLFQKRIYECLQQTRPGNVLSYSELAAKSGYPKAARAVGNALGRNPVPILVPCHRVVQKNNLLGGFSAGIKWKKRLLKMEGVI